LKLEYDEPLSNFAFKIYSRRYIKALTSLSLAGNPDLAALPEEVEQLSTARGRLTQVDPG
jgi:hypothetical protein